MLSRRYLVMFRILIFSLVLTLIKACSFKNIEAKMEAIRLSNPFQKLQVDWDDNLSPKIDTWFKELYTNTRFNGGLLVAKNGKVIYENTYGYANFKKQDTLTLNHSFQIGSVSKPFTAIAIMILKERGLLDYSDKVTKHLIGFTYPEITIWQLLTHRSGLSNYNYFCDEFTDKETIVNNNDVLKLIIDTVPAPYFHPNERFDYCNTNYVILASIVEKVAKVSFVDFMKKEVFQKAGMKSTWIFVNGKQFRRPFKTIGYHYQWEEALPTYQDAVVGDKNVYTTLADLWHWNKALENNKLLKKETLEEAFQPASFEKETNENYGYGWRLKTMIDSSKLVYHGGWWRGFNALFIKDKKNDAVVILFSNVRTRAIYAKYPELLGIIDPLRYEKQHEADSLYMLQKKLQESVVAKPQS
jgi:CubicO group peptidase (beta-lactamase class C family)